MFTTMLHDLRTQELQASDRVTGTMVSIGCNGSYYFDWIHENLGTPQHHIGLEFYMPKPDKLPANVQWIPNTAGNMESIANNSVDLVFAGQTIEHLWAQELSGFFLECARVLKPGGRLIFDSPNEVVTQAQRWNHPEHTIEIRPDDAKALASAAGFKVQRVVGHWLCQDASTVLGLTDLDENAASRWSRQARIEQGRARPNDCFSWWIEAVKTQEPHAAFVNRLVTLFWERYGASRVQRMMQTNCSTVVNRGRHQVAVAAQGGSNYLVYGPHAPLPPGNVMVGFDVDAYKSFAEPGHIELVQTPSNTVIARKELPFVHEGGTIWLETHLTSTLFGVEFRLWASGAAPITVRVGAQVACGGLSR
jgi:SAM-dependent methyltransferase